jgi:hypothetical protein
MQWWALLIGTGLHNALAMAMSTSTLTVRHGKSVAHKVWFLVLCILKPVVPSRTKCPRGVIVASPYGACLILYAYPGLPAWARLFRA